MRSIARAITAMELEFDVILSSPYVRARETAELVAKAIDTGKKVKFSSSLEPGGNPRDLIQVIKGFSTLPENLLLVGHEPHLSQLIGLFVFGESGSEITLKKGGFCKLSAGELHVGQCASLQWLLTPRQMLLMAGD